MEQLFLDSDILRDAQNIFSLFFSMGKFVPGNQEWSGGEGRGVGAGNSPDEECKNEPMGCFATHEIHS